MNRRGVCYDVGRVMMNKNFSDEIFRKCMSDLECNR